MPDPARRAFGRAAFGAAAAVPAGRATAVMMAADLAGLGLRLGQGAEGVAGLLLRFLAARRWGLYQVTAAEQARVAAALDPAFL